MTMKDICAPSIQEGTGFLYTESILESMQCGVWVCVCGSVSVKDKEGDIHTSIVLTIEGQ